MMDEVAKPGPVPALAARTAHGVDALLGRGKELGGGARPGTRKLTRNDVGGHVGHPVDGVVDGEAARVEVELVGQEAVGPRGVDGHALRTGACTDSPAQGSGS